jgi:uncharacterized protein (PEP-CTERM system associated)
MVMQFKNLPAVRSARSFRPLKVCWAIGLLGATALAQAQLTDGASSLGSSGSSGSAVGSGRSGGAAAGAEAGTAGKPGTVGGTRFAALVPRVSVDTYWTNNAILRGGGRSSDVVTTVRPGVHLSANGARLKAEIDYSLGQIYHARDSSANRTQNALLAQGSLEAVDNFAFVDFGSTISQQTVSAFGTQSDNDSVFNPNRTEVATYLISPYVRGRLGQWATYQARYTRQASRSKSTVLGDQDIESITGVLTGDSQQRAFTWSVDVARTTLDYSGGRTFESDRVRAVLGYPVTPQLQFALIPGWESNNYASISGEKEGHATYGGRIIWTPSNRTNVTALLEKRFFGQAHQISADYRTPRTAWRFSDIRDVATQENQLGRVNVGPLSGLLDNQFSSIEPDPVRRAQLVQGFLLANGLDGNTNVNVGFLTSGVSLNRRQDLAFTLLGRRDTFTVLAVKSHSSRLLQVPAGLAGLGDLATSSKVRQQGISLVYSRRLTPVTTFNVLATQVKSSGDLPVQSSTLRSLNLSASTRLGQHATGTVGVRRSLSGNSTLPYSESAVMGALTVQF